MKDAGKIIAGVLVGVGTLVTLISSFFPNKPKKLKEKTEFDRWNVSSEHSKMFVSDEIVQAKQHATRKLNELINKCKDFKIGKSGTPDTRHNNYPDFEQMYIIVESSEKEFINELEAHYNSHYRTHKKVRNEKGGSAGNMTDKNKRYFLYIVLNF